MTVAQGGVRPRRKKSRENFPGSVEPRPLACMTPTEIMFVVTCGTYAFNAELVGVIFFSPGHSHKAIVSRGSCSTMGGEDGMW